MNISQAHSKSNFFDVSKITLDTPALPMGFYNPGRRFILEASCNAPRVLHVLSLYADQRRNLDVFGRQTGALLFSGSSAFPDPIAGFPNLAT